MANKDSNRNYLQAEAAKLFIGELKFDAIRITEPGKYYGEYRLTQAQVLKNINCSSWHLANLYKHSPKRVEKLTTKGFTWGVLLVKYHDGQQVRQGKTWSLNDAFIFWYCQSIWGNELAEGIVFALGIDSLRDRCDEAHGLPRQIEARRKSDNQILAQRRHAIHPLFGNDSVQKIADFLKCGRSCPKLAKWFNDYVYCDFTKEEWADLNLRNPVINGKRNSPIYSWISKEAAIAHKDHFDIILFLVKISTTEVQFSENFRRAMGSGHQINLL